MDIRKVQHIAIICSDYEKSKHFYVGILGFTILSEVYRQERSAYMLKLALNGEYALELFSFPSPPPRMTNPEATGLRHMAFEVADLNKAVSYLRSKGVLVEAVRVDPTNAKRYTFFQDPDRSPIEICEA